MQNELKKLLAYRRYRRKRLILANKIAITQSVVLMFAVIATAVRCWWLYVSVLAIWGALFIAYPIYTRRFKKELKEELDCIE